MHPHNQPARTGDKHGAARLVRLLSGALLLALSLFGGPTNADESRPAADHYDFGGLVYAMTNDAKHNEIRVYLRNRHGGLKALPRASVATGGRGGADNAAIDPIGSQGALVYASERRMLFAVNAGSNSVSAFDVEGRGFRPRLRDVAGSGGSIPVSVAVSENRLYVLNAGGSASVTTFAIRANGKLRALGTLDLGLPAGATGIPFDQVMAPGQVGVDRLARHLLVVHAGGKQLLSVELDDAGIPAGPLVATTTPGDIPFAFDTTRYGSTLVAEAATGSVSAFDPPSGAAPLTVSAAAVPTGQAATCWIVVHPRGYAYVSNTGSNTLGVYRWTRTGQLELLDAAAAEASGAPIDLALANRGGFLYSLDAASGSISGFRITAGTGALYRVETEGGLPASAGVQGIAARDF